MPQSVGHHVNEEKKSADEEMELDSDVHHGQRFGEHLARRLVHISSSLFVLYFYLPDVIVRIGPFELYKPVFLVLLYLLIPVQMEYRRLRKGDSFFMLREYESSRAAAYFWTVSSSIMLCLLSEIGLPEYIAAPSILVSAMGDPLLGELRPYHRRYSWGITYLVAFSIFYVFLAYGSPNPLAMVLVASAAGFSTIFSESLNIRLVWGLRPEFFKDDLKERKILKDLDITHAQIQADDNMLIQFGPAIVMLTAYLIANAYGLNVFPPPGTQFIPEMAQPLLSL